MPLELHATRGNWQDTIVTWSHLVTPHILANPDYKPATSITQRAVQVLDAELEYGLSGEDKEHPNVRSQAIWARNKIAKPLSEMQAKVREWSQTPMSRCQEVQVMKNIILTGKPSEPAVADEADGLQTPYQQRRRLHTTQTVQDPTPPKLSQTDVENGQEISNTTVVKT